MEAFHWRYHPLAQRMVEIIESGQLGKLQHVEAAFCFPLLSRHDIRWQLSLAGGAMMDAGCYAVHMVRTMAAAEPVVTSATARVRSPGVDRYMRAEIKFPGGVTGRVTASMWSSAVLQLSAVAIGERATMRVWNPLAPHPFHVLWIDRHPERVPGGPTYDYQLQAFAAAVQHRRINTYAADRQHRQHAGDRRHLPGGRPRAPEGLHRLIRRGGPEHPLRRPLAVGG